ncbi:unnamed protein product [Aphanomyces euteiches]|uniref:Uncharacterized protein n=1 Tax=Aphanomyces euteiches TaxID=100861 RepID=A0A6G0X206_9STRA|nr:hypothetical protein Ae201684_009477 [Aphanomyces euteiches]KAH9069911.1 hypothetical protein Ae201684P_002286 [Aphanomyces euteiches]KAH9136213.1 hypothetical protein AeRB84_018544 [Aphanomyces euteiches]
MPSDTKWNWKELCTAKQENVSAASRAWNDLAQTTQNLSKLPQRKPAPAPGTRPPKLNAEQKRAASLAKYGIGHTADETERQKNKQETIERLSKIVAHLDPEPRMTQQSKFAIYNPKKESSRPIDPATTEEFSGLRIKDRLVPADEMKKQMQGRKFIHLASMDNAPTRQFDNSSTDWVAVAVMTKKNLAKSEHSPYVVWTLSDLENAMLSIFLYNDAYESHWKELEGSIVAIINPDIMPAKEHGRFALKVTSGANIVKLGTSIDFGFCKCLTIGGAQCKIPVNTSNGDFCTLHMAARFKEAGKGRMALNGPGTFRADVFRNGDGIRNISAGSYVDNRSKAKRKRADVFVGVATNVDATGNIQAPQSKKANVVPELKRLNPAESMAALRTAIQDNKKPPAKQSIVAKILGVGGPAKKVNLMQLMTKASANVAHKPVSASLDPLPVDASARAPAISLSRKPAGRSSQVTSLRATGMLFDD